MAHKSVYNDYDYKDKMSFLGDYFDYDAALHKNFLINFFPSDNTVEVFDKDMNRIYLKRSACEGLALKHMFLGNKIRIYGRQILITDYADCSTRKQIGTTKDHAFAIIKPGAVPKMGEILTQIQDRGFQICRMRMCRLTRKESLDFYEFRKGDAFLPFMLEHLVSGPILALELVGDNAIERWRAAIGPRDPVEARKRPPKVFGHFTGWKWLRTVFTGPTTRSKPFELPASSSRKGSSRPPATTAEIENCTCCIVKPHAIEEGKLGFILSAIMDSAKFKITAMQMFYLSTPNADEFLEVYKGLVSDFHAFMLTFLDGPCVALEIGAKQDGIKTQEEFRKFAGPFDADIARQIRPNSLRAMFGISKYKNAIHCTDLAEDTQLELEYFFKILQD